MSHRLSRRTSIVFYMMSKQGERQWQLKQENKADSSFHDALQKLKVDTTLSEITLRVCLQRGLRSSKEIQDFLFPKLVNLKDPFSIKDMDRAVDRVKRARGPGDKILIFGDYDVDGTTGAALLTWIFRDFGFSFEVRQPDRFKDGYGLNVQAVEDAFARGVKIIITVDCGISSYAAIDRAKDLSIDLIVIDHHQVDPEKGLPNAFAIVNPQREDCPSGLKELCGCALAFYFARALRSCGIKENWWGENIPTLKQHLDLVVLATAADLVPLVRDNHILVRHGLELLKQSKKPGICSLLQVSGILKNQLSPMHLGFVLGPRINASGRIAHANIALDLLTTQDSDTALKLAQELEKLNQERQTLQNQIWDEVRLEIDQKIKQGQFKNSIVVGNSNWHEGVVGIVASRIVETYQKPAVVVAFREGFGKGSVRSYAGKDVLHGLRSCASHLLGFGGHRHAAGLSLLPEKFQVFVEFFDKNMEELEADENLKPLFLEGVCALEELDFKTLHELERLGPFGPGNGEPIFSIKAFARNHRVLKKRHLKFHLSTLKNGESREKQPTIEAIWFHGVEKLDPSLLDQEREWAGVPEINRYQGRATPTFRVKDYKDPVL